MKLHKSFKIAHPLRLLFFVMLVMFTPRYLSAQEFEYTYAGQTIKYSVIDPEAKTVETQRYQDVRGVLVLPSNPKDWDLEYTLTEIGGSSFESCEWLTEVSIPASVTVIGDCAFRDCKKLSKVSLPNSLTTISGSAFLNCEKLSDINLPTSLKTIGDSSFSGCSSLSKVEFPPSLSSIMYGAFSRSNIEIADLSNIKLTDISADCFRDCKNLSKVFLPNSLMSIGERAFSYCEKLSDINLPSSLETIGQDSFRDCSNLSKVDFPPSLLSISGGAFYCSNIETADLSNTKLTDISTNCFGGCKNLKIIKLPQRINCISRGAFSGVTVKTFEIVPACTKVYSLPSSMEELYIASNEKIQLPAGTYSNTKLYADSSVLPYYEFHYRFSDYNVWNLLLPTSMSLEYDGETVSIDNHTCIVAPDNHKITIPFIVDSNDSPYDAVFMLDNKTRGDGWSISYDGLYSIVLTLKKFGQYHDYEKPFLIGSVTTYPHYTNTTTVPIYIYPIKDPNYPTALEFKNSLVRIKPYEYFYQPVEILPEGSFVPTLYWSSSDPSKATVSNNGTVSPIVQEGTVTITVTDGKDLSASYTAIIDVNAAGVDDITVDDSNTTIEYYNLQGVRISEPTKGQLVIRRQGSKSEKIIVK